MSSTNEPSREIVDQLWGDILTEVGELRPLAVTTYDVFYVYMIVDETQEEPKFTLLILLNLLILKSRCKESSCTVRAGQEGYENCRGGFTGNQTEC